MSCPHPGMARGARCAYCRQLVPWRRGAADERIAKAQRERRAALLYHATLREIMTETLAREAAAAAKAKPSEGDAS